VGHDSGQHAGAASLEERQLSQLKRWLTGGGSTVAVAGLALFAPYGIVFMILTWGAILFAPFLVWRLVQLKRFGWVAAFVIFVGAPLLYGVLTRHDGVTAFILSVFPLLAFYGYTWLLRHSVNVWLGKIQWKRHYP
jgi:hypothetical protein